MTYNSWVEYGNAMEIGNHVEVHYWEDSVSPGHTNDLCLFLGKIGEEKFCFYIMTPQRLGPIEDTETERDEDPDFFPDDINGEPVRRTLGEYYIGYDYISYPDPELSNEIVFNSFSDPNVSAWLKNNKVKYSLDIIIPGQITTANS